MAYQLVSQSGVGMLPATSTPAPGVTPVAVSQPPQTGLLAMPDFTYDNSGLALDGNGTLQASALLGDYYGQMAEKYLPMIDTFAKDNAGQMVAYDPDKMMSIEDFSLGVSRGDLRNQDLSQSSHDVGSWLTGQDGASSPYYYKTEDGQYHSAFGKSDLDGKELFTPTGQTQATWENPDGTPVYTSAGTYHKETAQEAADRLLAQGGGYSTGSDGKGNRDFMGEKTLNAVASDNADKWGQDFVNMPELKPYLDDPAWVTKVDGKVTAVRAELLPLLLRESIGEEFRDMARGSTKAADGLGGLVKMVVIGVVTAGIGSGIAAAAGGTLSGATGIAGLTAYSNGVALTSLGSVGAGVAGGALSSAIQGGNPLEGAALGALSAAATPYVSKPLANAGLTNTTLNAGATRAITGGASAAIKGDDIGVGAVAGSITGMVTSMLPSTGSRFANNAINSMVGNVVGGYVNQLIGSTSGAPAAPQPATSTPPATSSTPATPAPNNRYYVAGQSRVNI